MGEQGTEKRRPSKLERTAYHEAGHAVAAYLVHRRITKVSTIPDPDKNTLGHCEHARMPSFHPGVDYNLKTRNQVEKRIITLLGGPVTERLLVGRVDWKGSDSDIHCAFDLAFAMCSDDKEASAYVGWLWEHTRALLSFDPYWAMIQALAEELTERRYIGERLARKIITEAKEAYIERELARIKSKN